MPLTKYASIFVSAKHWLRLNLFSARTILFQSKVKMASSNPPGVGEAQPREIKVLETAEDIQQRRDEVLSRYAAFKQACSDRKALLEDSRRYQYFKRDADELESWILEKLQTASDESYKDPTNLQVSTVG